MEVIKFTETIFSSNGKKGIITPDSDGYYTVILGALNVYNSAKEYYTAQGVVQLFNSSSSFLRKIKNAALYAELGHPKKENMSYDQYYNRICTIDERNICAHISEVSLDFNYGKNNPEFNAPDMIAVIGKVKPIGPNASFAETALTNPKQNSAFSVRGLTENKFRNGRTERTLTDIITWDMVPEPGIRVACKAYTPGLENKPSIVLESIDTIVDTAILKKTLKRNIDLISLEEDKGYYADILSRIEKTNSRLSSW